MFAFLFTFHFDLFISTKTVKISLYSNFSKTRVACQIHFGRLGHGLRVVVHGLVKRAGEEREEDWKLVQKVRESGEIANSPKSRDLGSLQVAEFDTYIFSTYFVNQAILSNFRFFCQKIWLCPRCFDFCRFS